MSAQTVLTEEMRLALESNANSLSPISVEWERTRTSDLPESTLLATLGYPATALDVLGPEKVQFMWQGGSSYIDYVRHVARLVRGPDDRPVLDENNRLVLQEQEMAFNGRAYFNGDGDAIQGGAQELERACCTLIRWKRWPRKLLAGSSFVRSFSTSLDSKCLWNHRTFLPRNQSSLCCSLWLSRVMEPESRVSANVLLATL